MNYEEIIDSEFSGNKNRVAKEALKLAKKWMEDNKGLDDRDACAKYLKSELNQKFSSIIGSIILGVIVQLIVKFIINRWFTNLRDDYFGIEDLNIEETIWETEGGIPRFE